MHPDDVALVDLVIGQPVEAPVAAHVATCRRCADELASLREVVGLVREPDPELLPVPSRVWDAVAAGLEDTPAATPDTASDELSARRERRGRRRVAMGWVAGAAAAGIVVGVVGARAVDGDQASPVVTVASTTLDTLDTRQAMGSADVVRHDGRVDLDVRTERMDAGSGYLEVWLINRDLKRMVSVGVLEPDRADQSFAIPQVLLDEGYVIVDISREGFDGEAGHSGDSIVRGTLAT